MDAVGHTALVVAAVRAAESRRPDRLFEDPIAASFVEDAAAAPRPLDVDAPNRRVQALARGIVVRTRFFDDLLTRAASECPQVVLLGAGLDVRAYRLPWPEGVTLFELDREEVLAAKQATLDRVAAAPRCRRVVTPIDLRDDWPSALAHSGHRAEAPTMWLAEGLLAYLDGESVDLLLDRVGARSAPTSRLGLTVRTSSTKPLSELWTWNAPADPRAWLAAYGWDATPRRRGDLAAQYGRPEWSDLVSPSLIEAVRAR
jgi:methyltransferase (TIGR00027 family)